MLGRSVSLANVGGDDIKLGLARATALSRAAATALSPPAALSPLAKQRRNILCELLLVRGDCCLDCCIFFKIFDSRLYILLC